MGRIRFNHFKIKFPRIWKSYASGYSGKALSMCTTDTATFHFTQWPLLFEIIQIILVLLPSKLVYLWNPLARSPLARISLAQSAKDYTKKSCRHLKTVFLTTWYWHFKNLKGSFKLLVKYRGPILRVTWPALGFEPWTIRDKYSNFAGAYKITTLALTTVVGFQFLPYFWNPCTN